MRWQKPTLGKRRIHKRFAWLPINIGIETRWLEMVTTEQIWSTSSAEHDLEEYWRDYRFVSI